MTMQQPDYQSRAEALIAERYDELRHAYHLRHSQRVYADLKACTTEALRAVAERGREAVE